MKILFVADGRSPISQNWMRHFIERGDDVYLASTFDCDLHFPLKGFQFTPVAFSEMKKKTALPGSGSARTLGLRTLIRQWVGPLSIFRSAFKLRAFIRQTQPDLIHAMRIPYEGMLAASALDGMKTQARFLTSVWGNDFTLYAAATPLMKYYTRKTLNAADALHADCARDARLAQTWGFGLNKPTLVVPGNGGIRGDLFYPPLEPVRNPIIINPRGFRAYVQNEAFFKSIPLVLEKQSEARFICSSMQGEPQVLQWINELNIGHAVQLNPLLPHAQMGDVFRAAQVMVSPSIHDGTPNSLLEGMACGCFPVAGDLESIREWITHGQNGLLVDPNNPQAIADAILIALQREDLRREAAGLNQQIISERAEYKNNMRKAEAFYQAV